MIYFFITKWNARHGTLHVELENFLACKRRDALSFFSIPLKKMFLSRKKYIHDEAHNKKKTNCHFCSRLLTTRIPLKNNRNKKRLTKKQYHMNIDAIINWHKHTNTHTHDI
jgi:hypothetical protein